MIYLKSPEEIAIMREGGAILGGLLDNVILCKILEGVSTIEIDKVIETYILENNAVPILKGYVVDGKAFSHSSCISVNDEVVHAPPSNRTLKLGDIVTVDVSIRYKGYCLDAARTFPVGRVSDVAMSLITTAKDSFFKGLENFVVGKRVGDISNSIQTFVESKGHYVIKDFCGHGIGKNLHEGLQVMNFGEPGLGPVIEEGLTIALEPMISERDEWTFIKSDGWTAVTRSGSLSSHYEDTVVALNSGPEILTKRFD